MRLFLCSYDIIVNSLQQNALFLRQCFRQKLLQSSNTISCPLIQQSERQLQDTVRMGFSSRQTGGGSTPVPVSPPVCLELNPTLIVSWSYYCILLTCPRKGTKQIVLLAFILLNIYYYHTFFTPFH